MPVRLFFALWPEPALQSKLAEWGRVCHKHCGGRTQQLENLHVTLAFLGEIEAERCAMLHSVAQTLRSQSFELCLDRIGYWRHSRIVYATVTQTPLALSDLVRSLTERLAEARFRTEQRTFIPHVTLLRNARTAPPDLPVAPIRWHVSALSLVETLRSEQKLSYRRLHRWTLSE